MKTTSSSESSLLPLWGVVLDAFDLAGVSTFGILRFGLGVASLSSRDLLRPIALPAVDVTAELALLVVGGSLMPRESRSSSLRWSEEYICDRFEKNWILSSLVGVGVEFEVISTLTSISSLRGDRIVVMVLVVRFFGKRRVCLLICCFPRAASFNRGRSDSLGNFL